MAESTLHRIAHWVADFLEAVTPMYLEMPRIEEKQQTSTCFEAYAGNKATHRSIAQLLGMAESTLHRVVNLVANVLEAVTPMYLKMLRTMEKQQTSSCFEVDIDDESATDDSSQDNANYTKESTVPAQLLRQLDEAKRRVLAQYFN
ncbi:hypothetical protein MRX96_036728 [Rhipicephalus microplus]